MSDICTALCRIGDLIEKHLEFNQKVAFSAGRRNIEILEAQREQLNNQEELIELLKKQDESQDDLERRVLELEKK